MDDSKGWIQLHRRLMSKGWYKDSEYVHLWIHLLLSANHKPNEWLYKDKMMKIERGQLITSRKSIGVSTGIERNKVERILKCFESEQQIKQQNLFTSRLITILNYDDYQKNEQDFEQPVSSKRAASEQRVSTNNNVNNVKIKKENILKEKSSHFQKPTPQQITEYAQSISFELDGNQFFDYYESKGWMIGKSKMKDWKAAVRTWKRNETTINEPFIKPDDPWLSQPD